MKNFNLLHMGYILSGLVLVACENNTQDSYEKMQKIIPKTEHSDSCFQLLSFTVNARNWQRISATDRYVGLDIPAITDKILKQGSVIIYLCEAEKTVSLPFTYYQVRRAMLFQPSYEKGWAYINILGNFIQNIHSTYTFRILVINEKGLRQFRDLNWYDYEEVKMILKRNSCN